MSIFIIPKEIEVKQMLGMLYDDGLTVQSAAALPTESGSKSLVALYIDDDDQPVTACACDYSFTAFAGAALTKIPKGGAEDAASSGDFSEMMLNNLNEVMNICSRLLMSNSSPHLRLDKTIPISEAEAAISGSGADTTSVGFSVNIPSYGNGQLLFRVS